MRRSVQIAAFVVLAAVVALLWALGASTGEGFHTFLPRGC